VRLRSGAMAATKRYAVNGIELDVIEAGDPGGPAVVLCHGFPESAHSWRHQIEPLAAAGYHVLAPDQRGYGRSSAPREVEAYGIEYLCGDLLGLLDATGHEDAVFVGHDWGALLVWDLARIHPERVRAVVNVSVPYTEWPAGSM
jgi:pimeloyl-ACP methyl ester carboxylesterase